MRSNPRIYENKYQGLKFALFPGGARRRGEQCEFKARQPRERRPNRPDSPRPKPIERNVDYGRYENLPEKAG